MGLGLCAPTVRAQGVSLGPKLGQASFPARYVYRADSHMSTGIGDMETASEAQMEAHFELTGSAPVLQLRFTAVKVSFAGGTLDGTFDSSAPANEKDPLDAVCRPLIGEPLTVRIDGDGRIERVDGLEKIKAHGDTPIQFGDLFGADAFRAMFQPILQIKPEAGDTHVGQSWYYDVPELGGLGMPARRYELTLKSARGDRAEIAIAPDPDAPKNADREEKASGIAVWDTHKGLLSKLETTSEARWSVTPGENGVKIATTSSVKIEREP